MNQKNTGTPIQNPKAEVIKDSKKMTVNAPRTLTTYDGKNFEIKEMIGNFINNYKTLIPAYATFKPELETHTFFTKLSEIKEGKSLASQVTSESIEQSYIKLLKDGLSLYDGQTNLIKYGNELTCQPAAKGRVAQSKAVVEGLDYICAIVVYDGEQISSHFEKGLEVYDHVRNMSKRINSLDNIIGVYGYAYSSDGKLLESKWKSRLEIVKDWTSNNRYMPTQKINGLNKKIHSNDYNYYVPYLSDNHINRTEAMFIKTMEASLATILKSKYPHNDFKSKYLENIIEENYKEIRYEKAQDNNTVYDFEQSPEQIKSQNVINAEIESVSNSEEIIINEYPNLPDWIEETSEIEQSPELKKALAQVWTFGKYKGKTFGEIKDDNYDSYLKWAMETTFFEDVREICRIILESRGK